MRFKLKFLCFKNWLISTTLQFLFRHLYYMEQHIMTNLNVFIFYFISLGHTFFDYLYSKKKLPHFTGSHFILITLFYKNWYIILRFLFSRKVWRKKTIKRQIVSSLENSAKIQIKCLAEHSVSFLPFNTYYPRMPENMPCILKIVA